MESQHEQPTTPPHQPAQHQSITPQPSAQTPQPQGNGLAIASLVLGILAVTSMGLLTGIPAVITGAMSLKKKAPGRGMSIAGIITGAAGILWSILLIAGLIVLFVAGAANESYVQPDSSSPFWENNSSFDSSRT